MTLPVLILAAGLSTRMGGRDKLLEDIDATPLIARQAQTALGFSDQVYVALPPAPHPRHDALAGFDVHRIEVSDAQAGISASLRAGLAALAPDVSCVMLMLGDLPDITTADLQTVAQAQATYPDNLIWRGATADGKGGHPIIFDRALFADIAKLTGDSGAKAIICANADKTYLVALQGQRARTDLDTPEDWARWRDAR